MHTPCRILTALMFVGSSSALAMPIVFTHGAYTTFAQADAGGASDGPDSSASDGAVPISSAAAAASPDGDNASAVAFADTLFLTATSEANALLGTAAATAVGSFSGAFDARPGRLSLSLDFDALVDALAGGTATNTLAVTLEVGGITLFDALITDSTVFDQEFLLASGGAGLLDLTLVGTAHADPGAYAFSLASVNATLDAVPVPEPAGMALLMAGLASLGLARQRKPTRT